jgi:LytS/YehU family sensor histidine kinase
MEIKSEHRNRGPESCRKSHYCLLQKKSFQHFLFNAINSAVSLCSRDPMLASDLLVSISDFLRAGLEEEREQIPLPVELEYVRAYLEVQKVRFEQRLEVEYDIDPQANCLLPPFTLMQLVDNGIRHGLMPRKTGGTLKIIVARRDYRVRIVVEDDGVGIAEEVLQAIREGEGADSFLYKTGRRWQAHSEIEWRIQSTLEKGTCITVDFPCLAEE